MRGIGPGCGGAIRLVPVRSFKQDQAERSSAINYDGYQTAVILTNESGHEFIGRARHAEGKTTTIKLNDRSFSGDVQKVRVIGRQELTSAEKSRDEFMLHVLQGQKTLRNSTFIRRLWFPSHRKHRSGNRTQNPPALSYISDLNQSQNEAVSAMVSESEPLVIVHGE
jgi:regulator of nonsense transcripts 1